MLALASGVIYSMWPLPWLFQFVLSPDFLYKLDGWPLAVDCQTLPSIPLLTVLLYAYAFSSALTGVAVSVTMMKCPACYPDIPVRCRWLQPSLCHVMFFTDLAWERRILESEGLMVVFLAVVLGLALSLLLPLLVFPHEPATRKYWCIPRDLAMSSRMSWKRW